jgi:hypothetical protein
VAAVVAGIAVARALKARLASHKAA